jgi:hypothetical protein
MMEVLSSSATLVLTIATRPNTQEDAILHSHRRENLKYYIKIKGFWQLRITIRIAAFLAIFKRQEF